jgi:hypothetical protein
VLHKLSAEEVLLKLIIPSSPARITDEEWQIPTSGYMGMGRMGCEVVVTLDDVSVEITAQLQNELTYARPFCVHLYSTDSALSRTALFLIHLNNKRNKKYNFLVKNK